MRRRCSRLPEAHRVEWRNYFRRANAGSLDGKGFQDYYRHGVKYCFYSDAGDFNDSSDKFELNRIMSDVDTPVGCNLHHKSTKNAHALRVLYLGLYLQLTTPMYAKYNAVAGIHLGI